MLQIYQQLRFDYLLYHIVHPHGNHIRYLQLEVRGRSSGGERSYLGIVNFVNSVSKN